MQARKFFVKLKPEPDPSQVQNPSRPETPIDLQLCFISLQSEVLMPGLSCSLKLGTEAVYVIKVFLDDDILTDWLKAMSGTYIHLICLKCLLE